MRYEIHVEGRVDRGRSEWFDGMRVTSGPDGTRIAGDVADQSALHGLLDRVRDFGLTVVSVNRVDPGTPDNSTPDDSTPDTRTPDMKERS